MPVRNTVIGQHVDAVKVQRAKELRREMTPAEKALWAFLRGNRMEGFHFRRQQVINGFIVDFYCHAAALVIEVDGSVHDAQVDADAERDQVLRDRGFHILRIRNEDITSCLDNDLERIRNACHRGARKEPT